MTILSDMTFAVSAVPTADSYRRGEGYIPVTPLTLRWEQIIKYLEGTRSLAKKDGPALVPSHIGLTRHPKTSRVGRWRHKRGARYVTLLCLDVEGIDLGGDDPFTCAEWLAERIPGVAAYLYTSWHHGVATSDSGDPKWTPGYPRFRAVIPLSRPLGVKSYQYLSSWALEVFGAIDTCVKDPVRLYYGTRADHPRAEVPGWQYTIPGAPLDPMHLLDADGEPTDLRTTAATAIAKKRQRDEQRQKRLQALKAGSLVIDASRQRKYAVAALRGMCSRICEAGQGERHATIAKVSAQAGGMVLPDVLEREEAFDALLDAAHTALPSSRHDEAHRTIHEQMAWGATHMPFDWSRIATPAPDYDPFAAIKDPRETLTIGLGGAR